MESELEVPSMCENTKNECLFLVPLFYFKWEGNVCPSTWEGHVCRSRVGSVFLFSFSLTCLHVCTRSLPRHTNRTHMWLKIPRMCRPHKISSIAIASMCAPAHFSCSHSTSSTLTSSSSIPSSRTTSQVTLPISKHCAAPPIVGFGPLAFSTSSTGFVPNVIDNFDLSETWNLPPGAIHRHDVLVHAWRGAHWRDHRQSAIITTVHSGARRTSGP